MVLHTSFGREAIFCNWRLPLRCLHVIHLKMNDLTVALQLIFQNPEDLIPSPEWATFSLQHLIINLASILPFGINRGCLKLLSMVEWLNRPPTLSNPFAINIWVQLVNTAALLYTIVHLHKLDFITEMSSLNGPNYWMFCLLNQNHVQLAPATMNLSVWLFFLCWFTLVTRLKQFFLV